MHKHVPNRRGRAAAGLATALCGWALLVAPAAAQGSPQGAQLFNQRCASCHTMGQGDRVGPDLLGVLDRREQTWVANFIADPSKVIDAGDPVANELLKQFNGVRMPAQQLNDTEREALFSYLQECTQKGGCLPGEGAVREVAMATPEEVERGRQLFEGKVALANGGAACAGCHNVRGEGPLGGGTLGADLTFAYARMGERKLTPALAEPDSPMMKALYAKAPLTEDEQFQLKAWLAQVSKDGTPPRKDRDFVWLGVVGALVALGFIEIARGGEGRTRNGRGDT